MTRHHTAQCDCHLIADHTGPQNVNLIPWIMLHDSAIQKLRNSEIQKFRNSEIGPQNWSTFVRSSTCHES